MTAPVRDGELLLQMIVDRDEAARRLIRDGRLTVNRAHDPVAIGVALAEVLAPWCGTVRTPLRQSGRQTGTQAPRKRATPKAQRGIEVV